MERGGRLEYRSTIPPISNPSHHRLHSLITNNHTLIAYTHTLILIADTHSSWSAQEHAVELRSRLKSGILPADFLSRLLDIRDELETLSTEMTANQSRLKEERGRVAVLMASFNDSLGRPLARYNIGHDSDSGDNGNSGDMAEGDDGDDKSDDKTKNSINNNSNTVTATTNSYDISDSSALLHALLADITNLGPRSSSRSNPRPGICGDESPGSEGVRPSGADFLLLTRLSESLIDAKYR